MSWTILNVDDDAGMRYSTTRILSRAGFVVQEAGTAAEAAPLIAAGPDVILLDIQLPDANGIDVCRRLKADPATASIPVLQITSTYLTPESWAAALEGGADAYLTHPVEPPVLVATVRALLRAREAEREARRVSGVLTSTFNAIRNGVALLDTGGLVVECNATFCQIVDRPREQVIGAPAREPLADGETPAGGWPFDRLQRSHTRETSEMTVDGRWFEVTCDPIIDEAGALTGAVEQLCDISDRKHTELERTALLEREQASRREAERANRLKDDFLATLSHELRTPLNAIVGWAHMLRTQPDDAGVVTQAVETIERNAMAQSQLIEDILDVSRIVSGSLRLDVQDVDLPQVMIAAGESLRLAASAKEIDLRIDAEADLGGISGDPARLQQVLWNLLSNAIKFTPRGGRVTLHAAPHDSQHVEIVVQDSGPGIDPAFLPYVFERFRQADASTTREHGGLGLGLAIVRHLVELHGGSVRAETQDGARFTLLVPRVSRRPPSPIKLPALASVALSADTPRLDGLSVLVVDDDQDSLEMMRALLATRGAHVMVAASIAGARALLEQAMPDMLLSDLGLPGEDGFALIRHIRRLAPERGGAMPAIAVTGYVREKDRQQALDAGFDAHVAKPIDPSELCRLIGAMRMRIAPDSERMAEPKA